MRPSFSASRPIAALRLDPTNRNGKLVLGPIWIQRKGETAAPWPRWVKALLRLIDWTMPPSLQRCRWKAEMLVRLAGSKASAATIAQCALSDPDRHAIAGRLQSAFLKQAGTSAYEQLYREQLRTAQGGRGADWRERTKAPVDSAAGSVKAIAFYLPQFHPIPENDRWWGEGFTEWRNVAKAAPQFVGHRQPRRPAELGFYDLRNPEVMRRQIDMAREHGLHGFCFHHYWFHGKRLLERPVDQFLADPTLDLPFCLCWANENWTRRWDGAEHEILIAQDHSPEDDRAFFADLSRYLRDPRYITVDGKPLVIVYRPSLLSAPAETAARWRAEAARIGLPGLFLVATNAFGFADHAAIGFDALVEFPPHARVVPVINEGLTFYNRDFAGMVHDYADIAKAGQVGAGSGIIRDSGGDAGLGQRGAASRPRQGVPQRDAGFVRAMAERLFRASARQRAGRQALRLHQCLERMGGSGLSGARPGIPASPICRRWRIASAARPRSRERRLRPACPRRGCGPSCPRSRPPRGRDRASPGARYRCRFLPRSSARPAAPPARRPCHRCRGSGSAA